MYMQHRTINSKMLSDRIRLCARSTRTCSSQCTRILSHKTVWIWCISLLIN